MAILESVRELATKLGADTNGRTIADQINIINRHLEADTANDIAGAVKEYSKKAGSGGGGETFEVILNTSDGETFTPNKTFAETVQAIKNSKAVIMKMRYESIGEEKYVPFFYNAFALENIDTIYVSSSFMSQDTIVGYVWNEAGFGVNSYSAKITIDS